MPYIGNNHIAGDHTNNFKVLDDISSFTATFDGSATSVVDTTNNTIRVVEHRFIQGQRVTYTNGGGGNIGGLTTGTAYFVIFDSASTIKLATNASNAANSTAINLSAVGTGSSHTLNAAFDGVNTKFKLTHGSGTGARLNNATQINVAINNVLQRPNLDPNNFTDGFALEDNHKIVFQTAPTSEDIFWGSIIANTLTTFDISDHKIDTFTGDGSTTEFNLSHTPANNESLMVTINGVLQHPSNASTTRAYTLIANVIQFTAAPGVGDEIQVRHIGFAGATTADVSGFYGRTGNVVLTDQDDVIVNKISVGTGATIESNGQATFTGIVTFGSSSTTINNNVVNVGTALTLGHTQGVQFHTQNLHADGFEINNINASGIITASQFVGNIGGNPTFSGDATFSGNVSIGGTLTYEDVTNIDSVGIITARDGLKVLAGGANVVGVVTATTFKGDGDFVDIDVDGHTNLDNVSIAGFTTFAGDIRTLNIFPAVSNLDIGSNSNPFRDIHLSNDLSLIDNGLLKLGTHNDFLIQSTGNNNFIEGGTGFSGNLYLRAKLNQEGISIVSDGAVTLNHSGSSKLVTSSGGVGVTGDITVSGTVDGVDIAALNTTVGTKLANIVEDTSPQLGGSLQSNGHHIYLSDQKYIWFGTTGTGIAGYSSGIYFEGNSTGKTIYIRPKLNQESIKAEVSGPVSLYYSGSKKIETSPNGIDITGGLTVSGITTITTSSNEELFRIQTSFGNGGGVQGKALMGFDHFSVSEKPAILIGSEEEGTSSHKGSFVVKLKDAAATDDDPVERLRITSAGKVLIGDGSSITPSRNLDVRGSGHQQILLGSTNNAGVSLMLDGHGDGDGSGGNYGVVEMGSDGDLDIRNYDPAKDIKFGVGSNTGAEDTLILTSDGNLGLSNTGTNNPNNYSGWTTLTLNGTSGAELDFEKGGSLKGDILANDTAFNMTTRDSAVDINFATKNNAGSSANRLTINSEGSIQHKSGSGVSYFNGASEYVFGSTGSSPPSGGAEANVQIHAHKTRAQFSINAYMNNAGGPFMQLVSSRSGTVGTLGSATLNNDGLGDIRFSADDGNGGIVYGAQITGRAKSAATTNGIAGRIEFSTAKDSSSTTRQIFSMNEGGAFTAESESPALYGYYTSLNNQNHYVDFPQWTRDSFICLEIFGNVNPNSAGSGAYSDPVHMYVYKGNGWTGSRLGYYIYCVSVAPPARHAFPSGTGYSGNAQISAVWTDGSSVIGNETGTSTHYLRLLVPNGNNTYSFQKQFRIFRRR